EIPTYNDTTTKSVIELQVDDFVPTFFGQESLVFPPMTDEQIRNIDILAGVIFETTRRPSLAGEDPATITRPPNIEHRARIDHGVVVYEYNIGYGKESLTSPNAVLPHEWNTIRLINNDTKAVLQLNSGPPIIKPHHPTRFEQGTNGPVYLGGHVEPTDPNHTHQGFKVISSMTVSGKPVDLGSVVRSPHMVSHDSCAHVLCLHSSRCRNANIPKGYECICPLEYTGEHCERRSYHDISMNLISLMVIRGGRHMAVRVSPECHGATVTKLLYCEVPVHTPLDGGLGFGADTSFMTMPRPKDLDHFQVSMSLKPQDVEQDHMLLYVGADYDPDSSTPPGLLISQLTISWSSSGREELRSLPIEPGVEYTVVLSRNDSNELKTFEPGTDLFVGGLPPGLDIPDDVPATSFFGSPSPTEATTTEEPVHVYETDKDSDAPEPIIPKVDEFEEQEVKEEVVEEVVEGKCEKFAYSTTIFTIESLPELVTEVPLWVNTTEEVCIDHGCGPNGECIAVNQTYYRCQCNLYYDGPRCDLCEETAWIGVSQVKKGFDKTIKKGKSERVGRPDELNSVFHSARVGAGANNRQW
ncbi:unnamed protein product, partial [Haemonchus placei]|uniref:EGF-like domain-containing protein n=1 Tax=Haemonchus placei TaxID=6290 RepID=A0A0N4X0Z6_HAEPC